MPLNYTIDTLSSILDDILGPETSALIDQINRQPGDKESPFIYLPDGQEGVSKDKVTRLIAKTSNEYAKAVRRAGLARAQFKIATAAYKHKFRTSLGPGKNAGEREGAAQQAAQAEYEQMILLEAIVELCESVESSTRIASESSRRMLLGADQEQKADSRIETFATSEDDFTPF